MLESNYCSVLVFLQGSSIMEQLNWPDKKLFTYVLRRQLGLKSVVLSFDSLKHFVLYYLSIKL